MKKKEKRNIHDQRIFNKEITKAIPGEVKKYNTDIVNQMIIKQKNGNLEIMRQGLNLGRKDIYKLKNFESQIRSNFHRSLTL